MVLLIPALFANNEPIIFFDGDKAGKHASNRVLDIALQHIGAVSYTHLTLPTKA